ncbi:hypothetical protein SAMD00019534_059550 [Acytostelium subglobosum LB1]|uniref:hypothetical protein n=1 Tax=Acytostelium subglobosum LB1 TaxID=1410327 RepID=UPI00064516C8|nr:hypothetical protein SAMD00019534_059550 [Acytostelium subglobosum LB1]GAM22780.1 hypothetical protein SAMD00019534_059550 [Acytostelium subglobosum LB1]|eukprot:XP_012754007.1 hypothetical protein SAMD00019534_059550 [Acytostelium subglobosum LB1]
MPQHHQQHQQSQPQHLSVPTQYQPGPLTPPSPASLSPRSPDLGSDLMEGSTNSKKGFYGLTSNLLELCQKIDQEHGVTRDRSVMLNELHSELDGIIKKINRVKKNKLPYPPVIPADVEKKDFIDLRPRRNRKSKGGPKKDQEDDLVCLRCGTKESPEWRKGPDGCKSLCNACGIYFSKTKKRELESSTKNIVLLPSIITPTISKSSDSIDNTSTTGPSLAAISINSLISNNTDDSDSPSMS